jgi:hypothetical protein
MGAKHGKCLPHINILQPLLNRYLQGMMGVRCDEIASNTDGAVWAG